MRIDAVKNGLELFPSSERENLIRRPRDIKNSNGPLLLFAASFSVCIDSKVTAVYVKAMHVSNGKGFGQQPRKA
jgi:hypothetical protein